jgi:hypothetical protein
MKLYRARHRTKKPREHRSVVSPTLVSIAVIARLDRAIQ